MSDEPAGWTATIRVHVRDPALGSWVERALRPEAAREVPRARAELRPLARGDLEVTVSARDIGAMRAALNTYLGWIHLALATALASAGDPAPGARPG